MGSLTIQGGGGPMGWEFFTNFDAYDKESIKGTKAFFDDSQRWMIKKGLGLDMGRWNADVRGEDGRDLSQEQMDAFASRMPQPLVPHYQWKVRETFNPENLTGSYYRALSKLPN